MEEELDRGGKEACHTLAIPHCCPHYLRSCPSRLHNSLCGPLPPVPTPALEVVQSQMEKKKPPKPKGGRGGQQNRESVVLRTGATLDQWGLGRGMRVREGAVSTPALFALPPLTWELPFTVCKCWSPCP